MGSAEGNAVKKAWKVAGFDLQTDPIRDQSVYYNMPAAVATTEKNNDRWTEGLLTGVGISTATAVVGLAALTIYSSVNDKNN